MNKVIFSLFVLCFTVFTVSAQTAAEKQKTEEQKKMELERMAKERAAKENQTNSQVDNPNAPVVTFDKLVHDYGTLFQHEDGNCEFIFTNEGKEPLVLSNVRAS